MFNNALGLNVSAFVRVHKLTNSTKLMLIFPRSLTTPNGSAVTAGFLNTLCTEQPPMITGKDYPTFTPRKYKQGQVKFNDASS